MKGELIKPGKYPPAAIAKSGCAMPLTIPAIARNQAAKNAAARADRSPGTEATQIPSHVRLKTTKTESGMPGRPSRTPNRS